MLVVAAPDAWPNRHPSLFLAGGITNCPPWQDDVICRLADEPGLLLNPRRQRFPIENPHAAGEQIQWEFEALMWVDVICFWFCSGQSLQPIALYELGRYVALCAERDDLEAIVVGTAPGYLRESDVYYQLFNISPTLAAGIVHNLDDLVHKIRIALRAGHCPTSRSQMK